MSSSRNSSSPVNYNSFVIRQEISRFESVHPSIYTIYDIIEQVEDKNILESLRELVISIEDAFVNSQEWTLSHNVPDIRLGIVGSVHSGKSALVHRYLTGTYMQDESPEGGRFKKEVFLEGQSFLLLIRDEGGPPDQQFSHWVDGVIFVFSLENEESFQVAYDYFAQLAHYRNTTEIPVILVGTQDAISESNPRLIDDTRARKLASDLRRCSYYETCATYGLNVERVFQDACHKIIHSRLAMPGGYPTPNSSRPTTPQHLPPGQQQQQQGAAGVSGPSRGFYPAASGPTPNTLMMFHQGQAPPLPPIPPPRDGSGGVPPLPMLPSQQQQMNTQTYRADRQRSGTTGAVALVGGGGGGTLGAGAGGTGVQGQRGRALPDPLLIHPQHNNPAFETTPDLIEDKVESGKDLPTPSSTPTQTRKTRRKSNLFRKEDDREKEKKINGIGSGRSIPLKQGFLYKRTSKPLNKEWKTKKYVTLTDDAHLTYHPSMHDYMEMTHGKEIDLSRTTVKIPGVVYRQSGLRGTSITSNGLLRSHLNSDAGKKVANSNNSTSSPSVSSPDPVIISNDSMTSAYLTDLGVVRPTVVSAAAPSGPGGAESGASPITTNNTNNSVAAKKRHRRVKSNPKTNATDGYDSEGYEFQLISPDRQWHFEASSAEDRDDWVLQIERAIMTRLQLNDSGRRGRAGAPGSGSTSTATPGSGGACSDGVQSIRMVAGNDSCADCGAPDPEWASLNLGALVCIGCSGVHRQLGTHISRIRSLQLDDWPPESVAVMRAIGNTLANSVWEAAVPLNAGNRRKPEPSSAREEKEVWIRAKYERREFLPPVPYPDAPIQQQLIDAIARQDTRQVVLCLALAGDAVNAPYSRQDPRAAIHIAATLGNLVYIQLLLWYNGSPTVTDNEGRNAFYYAYCSGQTECAELLLQNGCPKQAVPPLSASVPVPLAQPVLAQFPPQLQYPGGATLPRRRTNFLQQQQQHYPAALSGAIGVGLPPTLQGSPN